MSGKFPFARFCRVMITEVLFVPFDLTIEFVG